MFNVFISLKLYIQNFCLKNCCNNCYVNDLQDKLYDIFFTFLYIVIVMGDIDIVGVIKLFEKKN